MVAAAAVMMLTVNAAVLMMRMLIVCDDADEKDANGDANVLCDEEACGSAGRWYDEQFTN